MISVTVFGNVGKDAELRYANDTPVLSFSVASNKKVKGEGKTQWVNCAIFGERGKKLAEFVTKGTGVIVIGTLDVREYSGKNGKCFSLDVRVNELEFTGGGKHEGGSDERPAREGSRGKAQRGDADEMPY